jgi:hypothetical protein
MKIKGFINIILLSVILTSCNDWLELLPPQGLTRDEFWKTKEDVEASLMGAYDAFSRLDGWLFKYGEIRADLVKGDNNQSSDERMIVEGNIYQTNNFCKWDHLYKVINYCNEVIKFAPQVKEIDKTFTDYKLKGYLSEAYFLRGLLYFYLVRLYKDVPYITEPSVNDDVNFYVPKNDGDSILHAVKNDLDMVKEWAVIDDYMTLTENKSRVTRAAIYSLLADISLWLFEYEDCIKYVDYIETLVQLKKYELMPSSRWFELFFPGSSLETIFEFHYSNIYNERNSTYDLTNRYSYQYDPSDKALELFGLKYAHELNRGEGASIKKYSETDYIIWKYVGMVGDGLSPRSGIYQNSAPFIIYRLADVMLMKAEALSQIDRFSEALTIINQIRERADVPPLLLSDSRIAYEDAILNERALELAFEGKRWFDLLRMGRRNNFSRKDKLIEIIVKNVPSTQKRILSTKLANPLGWYLPIHKDELERNSKLVQNPYYKY